MKPKIIWAVIIESQGINEIMECWEKIQSLERNIIGLSHDRNFEVKHG